MANIVRLWLGHGLGPVVFRWWRRRGLRARVTLTAALGLIVAFTVADLLLFSALRVSLTRSVDDSARSGAVEVQALINANRLPNPVPVPADITIQVLDSSGAIRNASSDADRLVPIVSARPGAGARGRRRGAAGARRAVRHAVAAAGRGGARQGRAVRDRGRAVQRGVRVAERGGAGAGDLHAGAVPRVHRGDLAGDRVDAAADRRAAPGGGPGHRDRGAVRPAGPRGAGRGPPPRGDPERHALPAGGGAAAAAGAGLGHRARAALADRVDPDPAGGRARLPRHPGLGDDGAGRARGRAAARPAGRGPAAARPPRRAGRPGERQARRRRRRPATPRSAGCRSTWPSSAARSSAATRTPGCR